MKPVSFRKHVAAGLTAALLAFSLPLSSLQAVPQEKPGQEYFEIVKGIDLLGEVYRRLSENYVEPLDAVKLMYAAIDGMLAVLDPYTVLLDENQSEELGEMTSGQYTGIGLSMSRFVEKVYITSVLEGYPAWKAGIRTGDRIVRINGNFVTGKNLDEIRTMMKGGTGTSLMMKIEREGGQDPGIITLSREEVRAGTVPYSGIIGQTGYLEISSFSSHATEEIRQAVEKLLRQAAESRQPMNGLIIDLRGNPGGLLTAAVEISSLFMEKGSTVVTIRGRSPESEKIYKTEQLPIAEAFPIAVLINRESASASEIISGAIQDMDRGVVLGERSYGKGLVQSVIRLPYDNTLKVTTAKYYTPSGRLIQKPHADSGTARNVLKKSDERKALPVYYTAGKRKVYGGGGIAPDMTVADVPRSEYEQELRRKGMIFLFAIRYRALHSDSDRQPLDRSVLIEEFASFLRKQNFSFTSAPERRLKELEESVAEEQGDTKAGEPESIRGLKQELARMKQKRVDGESERIARLLELEIMRHGDEKASRRAELGDDPVVQKALALLADPKAYSRQLKP